MEPKHIHIDLSSDGKLVAYPDPARVSGGRHGSVDFYNDTGEDISITFEGGTPFNPELHPHKVNRHGHQNSGKIAVPAGTSRKYTITTKSGKVLDPQVIIEE